MTQIKKIIRVVTKTLTVFLILLLLLVIYGKLSTTFSSNKYPNYFGYTFFEVASGSMEPTLKVNDVVLVKITKDNLKTDDIIAFQTEKTIITHRIIYMDNDTITVKGDSNNVVDKPIKTNQVIGKVIKIFPRLGIWQKVITDPKILIALFITLLLFDFALSYNSSKKKENGQKDDNLTPKTEDNIKIEKIEIKQDKPEKDIIDSDKLLEITRKIDIEDINKLIEGTELELSKKELGNVKKEIKSIEKDEDVKTSSKLNEKEKNFLDYTIRLDLNEIQKRIDKKIR